MNFNYTLFTLNREVTLKERLERIRRSILNCRKCELWRSKRNYVFGEGNPLSEIMFIGEAPGYNEDVQGRPFVGAAGKLLTSLIQDVIGVSRADVYITNILKCRPPNNRDPLPSEVEACTPYLDKQINIIKPKVIVTLGRHSTKYILSKLGMNITGITKVRGKMFEGEIFGLSVKVLPTYHPAAALYNPKLKNFLIQDFKKASGFLRGDVERNLLSYF